MHRTISRTLLVVSAAALLTACGDKAAETGVAQQPDANPTATVPTPANETAAPDFVTKAALSDMYEIESSKIAADRSTNPEIKAFAAEMIKAHTKSTSDLKAAIGASGLTLTPPAALDEDHAKKVADLKAADAKDFDSKYLKEQADAHQKTLDVVQRYANDGDNTAIKAFAAALAPVVQTHKTHVDALVDKLAK